MTGSNCIFESILNFTHFLIHTNSSILLATISILHEYIVIEKKVESLAYNDSCSSKIKFCISSIPFDSEA